MTNTTPAPRDPQDEQAELLAALAAARELGPDMDRALADSYLEKQRKARAAQPKPAAVMPHGTMPGQVVAGNPMWPMYIMPALGIIAFIVVVIVSQGALWWLFFMIPALTGWGWWGRHEGRDRRNRYRSRYGYPYDNRDDLGGPSAPATLGQPDRTSATVQSPTAPTRRSVPVAPPNEYD